MHAQRSAAGIVSVAAAKGAAATAAAKGAAGKAAAKDAPKAAAAAAKGAAGAAAKAAAAAAAEAAAAAAAPSPQKKGAAPGLPDIPFPVGHLKCSDAAFAKLCGASLEEYEEFRDKLFGGTAPPAAGSATAR